MALLAATKKTGELRVVGGRLDGRVCLDEGRVVAANVGRADSFVDAVFELLRLTSGKFSFDADKRPDDPTDPVDIEPLLFEAQSRLTEWRTIEAVVPSLDHGVVLVKDLADPHVTLASDQWRMVVSVAGARCVSDVAERLGLGEYSVCKALKDLVESGVVEIADPPAPIPKAEPKPEPKAEIKPAPRPEPKPEPAPEPTPEPEPEPAPVAAAPKADTAKVAAKLESPSEVVAHTGAPRAAVKIDPELKPEDAPAEPVAIPALKASDATSPIPPGEEPTRPAPKAAPAASAKPEPAKPADKPAAAAPKAPVDTLQAKALVSQLAAMTGDKPAANGNTKAAPENDTADAPDEAADAKAEATPDAPAGAAAEGGETDEPLNRGLLLKFLSSVRQ